MERMAHPTVKALSGITERTFSVPGLYKVGSLTGTLTVNSESRETGL